MIVNTERDLLHGGREGDKIGAYLGLRHYDGEHRVRSAALVVHPSSCCRSVSVSNSKPGLQVQRHRYKLRTCAVVRDGGLLPDTLALQIPHLNAI